MWKFIIGKYYRDIIKNKRVVEIAFGDIIYFLYFCVFLHRLHSERDKREKLGIT